jgi:cytochrome P450
LCEEREFYYVSHLAYVKALFLDSRASSDRVKPMVAGLNEAQRQAVEPLTSTLYKWLLFQDPPMHTPVRKLINQSLSNKAISGMETDIQLIVDKLVDGLDGESDLIAELAYPLPAIVISHILGVLWRIEIRLRRGLAPLHNF